MMMDIDFPELFPKITPEEIRKAPKLGHGADLRTLLSFLRLFGAISPTDHKIRMIARRLYETHQYDTTRVNQKTRATETFVEYDDETAYLRFDNVLSGKHTMIAREADFFRLSLQHTFGKELTANITDAEIMSGSAQLLIRRLLTQMPIFDWHRFDPLDALLALVQASEFEIPVSLTQIGTNRRWIVQDEETAAPDFPIREALLLRPGAKFKLTIPREAVRGKPLVLNFSRVSAKGELDGVRAQVMQHVVPTEDGAVARIG